MLTAIATLLIGFQSAGEAAVDILPDDPQTWVLEYPVVLKPYVEEYSGCLHLGVKTISGEPNFGDQHQADIPRCDEDGERIEREANEALERLGMAKATSPEDVANIFDVIRKIHVERGRDIDRQFLVRLDERPPLYAEDEREDEPTQSDEPTPTDAPHQQAEVPTN